MAPEYLPLVLEVYNDAMKDIWYVGIGMAGLALLASLRFEWKSVKGEKKTEEEEDVKDGEGQVEEKKKEVEVKV